MGLKVTRKYFAVTGCKGDGVFRGRASAQADHLAEVLPVVARLQRLFRQP